MYFYCTDPENIENYKKAKADNFKGWHCHHRLETHNSDGERRLVNISMAELKALEMYWNRPPAELIYLTKSEHTSLHNEGYRHSEQSKKKIGEKSKGRQTMLGKRHSNESKKRMSAAHKNRSEEHRKKISEAQKGKHWYNNGKENKFCYECPEGFVIGRLLIK